MTDEDRLQQLCVSWFRSFYKNKIILAVPNGGKRSIGVAKVLKMTGVLAGIPDLFVPYACGEYHGLWIEMKTEKGVVSIPQKEMMLKLTKNGYSVHIIRDYNTFQNVVKNYFNLNT